MIAKANILVIDDEVVVRQRYMRTLSSDHCNVSTGFSPVNADADGKDQNKPGRHGNDMQRMIISGLVDFVEREGDIDDAKHGLIGRVFMAGCR